MKNFSPFILLLTLFFSGCFLYPTPPPQPTPPAAPPAAQTPPSQVPAPAPNPPGAVAVPNHFVDVQITSPDLSKAIKSPLTIKGTISRIFVFEAQFPVVLKDANGKELAQTSAIADTSDMTKEMLPFTATLSFPQPSTSEGTLILEKDNASGLPENDDSRIFRVIFSSSQQETLATYNNEKYHFQVKYPSHFSLISSTNPDNMISIQFPDSYFKGTNLEDAKIEINVSNNVAECSQSGMDQHKLTKTKISNSITFYQDEWSEGAAGHKGDTISYNTVKDNNCFKIVLSMYSVNMDIFSNGNGGYMPGSPKEFDRQKIVGIFDQIFSTFKFL